MIPALAAGVYSAVAGALVNGFVVRGFRATDHGSLMMEGFMIVLTRLNGQQFVVNADRIRYVESTPDTVICCDSGDKLMVRETLGEVTRKAIDYARTIRRAITE
jgi:flagellar protein FlbD